VLSTGQMGALGEPELRDSAIIWVVSLAEAPILVVLGINASQGFLANGAAEDNISSRDGDVYALL